MKFRFPVVIIDEDFRSENISGSGIRALRRGHRARRRGSARAHELRRPDLVRPAVRAAHRRFILSIDDDESAVRRERGRADARHRSCRGDHRAAHVRRRSAPPTTPTSRSSCTAKRAPRATLPNDILRELHGFIHMFEDTPEFVARHIIREAKVYLDSLAPPFFKALIALRGGGLVLVALPGPLGRRRVPEESARADVPPVLRREHAARRRLQRRGRTRPAARSHRAGGGVRAQRGAHLQRGPPVLRDQRHVHVEQDGLARHRGAGRHRGGRPQLPQVDPARDHR